ncbi:MAG: lactate utilization protein C [Chitinophagaceae bacterium]
MSIITTQAKENILKRIRKALAQTTAMPFPQRELPASLFAAPQQDLSVLFAEQFGKLMGKFIYCQSLDEFRIQWAGVLKFANWEQIYCADEILKQQLGAAFAEDCNHTDLTTCDVAITGCEAVVARTGTLVLSAKIAQGRTTSVYAPIHICIAFSDQLVFDTKDALSALKLKYADQLPSLITFATGPSRTADIEKTLVVGVHGPKEVYCFLIQR